jgi:hypothetical protein
MSDDNKDKKVTFDADQQTAINALLRQEREDSERRLKAQYDPQIAESKTKLDQLTASVADLTQKLTDATKQQAPDAKKTPEYTELETKFSQLTAKYGQLESAFQGMETRATGAENQLQSEKGARLQTTQKQNFLEAVSKVKVNFFDPTDVYGSIAKELKTDDNGRTVVLDPATGEQRKNASFQPMSLEEYVSDFASKKKWLVQAAENAGGTGSGASDKMPSTQEERDQNETKRLAEIADPAKFQEELAKVVAEKQAAR